MQSFHRWTCRAEEGNARVKKMVPPPPNIKGPKRIRVILQQNEHRNKHEHSHRKREDSHMEVKCYLFYFKIILFLSVILLPFL